MSPWRHANHLHMFTHSTRLHFSMSTRRITTTYDDEWQAVATNKSWVCFLYRTTSFFTNLIICLGLTATTATKTMNERRRQRTRPRRCRITTSRRHRCIKKSQWRHYHRIYIRTVAHSTFNPPPVFGRNTYYYEMCLRCQPIQVPPNPIIWILFVATTCRLSSYVAFNLKKIKLVKKHSKIFFTEKNIPEFQTMRVASPGPSLFATTRRSLCYKYIYNVCWISIVGIRVIGAFLRSENVAASHSFREMGRCRGQNGVVVWCCCCRSCIC
jgi:hypothetical protein